MTIPNRKLGRTGVNATILGLGGEGILRSFGHEREAHALINRAIDLGITYLESARAYAGSESYYGLALGERRNDIFLTSKSHARDKKGALEHLEETLDYMNTDHLDLWQVHDVRTEDDIQRIFGPHGAIEAFADAKERGLTRFVGVTGHHNPFVLRKCLEQYDFDTVLFPVNPAEAAHGGFLDVVMPLAREKKMGMIGMKVYFRGLAARVPGFLNMDPYLRFALSWPVSTVVIGCDNLRQLEENIRYAHAFQPMSEEEMKDLMDHISPYAKQLMYYKP